MELFAAIRRDAPGRGVCRSGSWRTGITCTGARCARRWRVAIPPPRKTPARTAPRLEPFKAAIDAMLRSDLDAPKKQRHTARRVLARLVDEHGAGDLSYSTVRDHVAQAPPADRRRGGSAVGGGVRAADPSAGGRGRGRLPRPVGDAARGEDEDRAVHDAAVVLRPRGAPGVADPRAGGVPGRPRLRVRAARRRADRQDPLRQPQQRGQAGAVRPLPCGERALGRVPLALRFRRLLLPARP